MPEKPSASTKSESKVQPFKSNAVELLNTPSETPVYYANHALVRSTPFDLAMLFGQIFGSEGGKVHVTPLFLLNMAPAFAKALHHLLGMQIERYERDHGEISIGDVTIE